MTRAEHLLCILSEECSEVSQRVSKALRFGLDEVQANQKLDNAQRIEEEFADLLGIYELLVEEGLLNHPFQTAINRKKAKVKSWLNYSASQGTLTD